MSAYCKTEDEIIVDTGDYNSDEQDENYRLTVKNSGEESIYQSVTKLSSNRSCNILQLTTTVSDMISPGLKSNSSKQAMENEKRMRREIANSNERRRMQSINAGFQSLRSLLPHHEGEKLSKAAILQQTSQYIIELEREKTHLLSQNSQLKRTLGQHELMIGGTGSGDELSSNSGAMKKRKLIDNVVTLQTVSDSSDEGLGSMSPEPITLLNNTSKITGCVSATSKELAELKASLETEKKRRIIAEERLRQLKRHTHSFNQEYLQRGVIEHADQIQEEEILSITNDPLKFQVVEIDALPPVGQTQVVVCSPLGEVVDIQENEVETITDEMIHNEMIRDDVIIKDEIAEYVEVPSRLQPILEAAIKAEPKVEVERINATLTKLKDDVKDGSQQGNGRMYLTSTSRQNLETIVEAIRHLEGDHLFAENSALVTDQQKKQQVVAKQVVLQQEVPLALTNKSSQRKQLPAELSSFLQIKKAPGAAPHTATVTLSSLAVTSAITKANIRDSTVTDLHNSNSASNITFSPNNVKTLKAHLHHIASTSTPVATTTLKSSGSDQLQKELLIDASPSKLSSAAVPATVKQCRPGVIVAKQISS